MIGSTKSNCSTATVTQKPKKKKTRTTFTAYQLEELERAFERAPYPGNNLYMLYEIMQSCIKKKDLKIKKTYHFL